MIGFGELERLGLIRKCDTCSGNYTSFPPLTRQMCMECTRGFVPNEGRIVYWCAWAGQATMIDMCAGARQDKVGIHNDCGIAYLAGIAKHA